jgi:transposase-like protein
MKEQSFVDSKKIDKCPYCEGTDFIKFGLRNKKLEKIQVFFCNYCQKKFTPLVTKGKSYPLALIIRSLVLYNKFMEPKEISQWIKDNYGLKIAPQTVSNWIKEYQTMVPFKRMREYLTLKKEKMDSREMVAESRLFHQQIYDFKYHRWKTDLVIEQDFRNYKQRRIKDFLELVIAECPHQAFRESCLRASEFKKVFDLDQVRIVEKSNRANSIAQFVVQAVKNNKKRHEYLQNFMLFCDSTTLAVEVPILLDQDDISHFQSMLGFNVPLKIKEDKVITGHIDILQLRNGIVHIMDYKPSARKVKPIEQLTIYALALSRLTGLKLHSFKCAWFDENTYFEFFPLHVVYKKKSSTRNKIRKKFQ